MKKIFTVMFVALISASLVAQAPQRMSYQCVVRNTSGALVTSHAVGIRISVLQGSATGTVVFSETYSPVPQTNANGLVTLEIGSGTASVGTFAGIDWAAGPYFLKTETDPAGGTSYSITGTSQLLSVPYSLQSKLAEGVADNSISTVKIANNAVSVSKLPAGAAADKYLRGDGTWATPPAGGLTLPYSGTSSYDGFAFSITNSRSAIYGKSTDTGLGTVGVLGESASSNGNGVMGYASANSVDAYGVYGLSVGGSGVYGSGKKGVTGVVTQSNTYGVGGINSATIGSSAYGVYGTSQADNSAGVYGAALSTATDGEASGVYGRSSAPSGYGVYGIGHYGVSGLGSGPLSCGVYGESDNVGMIARGANGIRCHAEATGGIAVYAKAESATGETSGIYSMVTSPSGFSGYFIGGKFHVLGRVGFGTTSPGAGIHLKGTGWPESFLYLESASNEDAGMRFYEGSTARWSLFNKGGTGGLQIYNSSGVTAIICEQNPVYVGIGNSNPTCLLQVGTTGDGSQARANAWNILSDVRLKRDLIGISDPLGMVEKLNGYYYYWNVGNDRSRQVGFTAQEVKEVLPEAVSTSDDGYMSVEYGKIAPVLLEAIKALKAENDELKSRLEKIEKILVTGNGTF